MTITYGQMANIVADVHLREGAAIDWGNAAGMTFWFEIRAWRTDIVTGQRALGYGGVRTINPDTATESSIVRAIFGAMVAFDEHENREAFTYKGARVFGPHIDVNALADIADYVDYEAPSVSGLGEGEPQ